MKKLLFISLTALAFTACKQEKLKPVTGYNSLLQLDQVTFYKLSFADSVKGTVNFEFLVKNDTSSTPDTVNFNQFYDVQLAQFDQKFYFNTPEKTISTNFTFNFKIYGGFADSVNAVNCSYKLNDNTLLSRPLFFNNGTDKFFTDLTYNF